MRVLLDTNIVLDIMLRRAPWVIDGEVIWEANQRGHLLAAITASSFTDIYYITQRLVGREQARRSL
jgi:hypothetical protein